MCGHFWVHHTLFHLICKSGESMEPRHSRYWFSGATTDNKDILKSLFFGFHFASKYLTFCSVFERSLVFGFALFHLYPLVYGYIWVFLTERNKAKALRSWSEFTVSSRQSLLELNPQAVVRKRKKRHKLLQWVIRTVCIFNNSRLCTKKSKCDEECEKNMLICCCFHHCVIYTFLDPLVLFSIPNNIDNICDSCFIYFFHICHI